MKTNNTYCFLASPLGRLVGLFLLLCIAASCVKTNYDAPIAPAQLLKPSEAVTTLSENFDQIAKVDGQIPVLPKGWVNRTLTGNRAYQTAIMSNDKTKTFARCLQGTAYLALSNKVDSWLILPPLVVSGVANTTLSFKAAYAYAYGGRAATFEVRCIAVSENDEVPQIGDQWQKPFSKDIAQGKIVDWFVFEDINVNLSTVAAGKKVVYVAFRYIAENPALSSGCYIDDIKYN